MMKNRAIKLFNYNGYVFLFLRSSDGVNINLMLLINCGRTIFAKLTCDIVTNIFLFK